MKSLCVSNVAILGSGSLALQLACLFSNSLCTVFIYDFAFDVCDQQKSLSEQAVASLTTSNKKFLFHRDDLKKIHPKNYRDHSSELSRCELVIDATADFWAIKKKLSSHILPYIGSNQFLFINSQTKNTIRSVIKIFDGYQKMGFVNFFEPIKQSTVMECLLIDPKFADEIKKFFYQKIGKKIFYYDLDNGFCSQKIMYLLLMNNAQLASYFAINWDTADCLTGNFLYGNPDGTFHYLDRLGLDLFKTKINEIAAEKESFYSHKVIQVPFWMDELIEQGHMGHKTGQGVYKTIGDELYCYDLFLQEYRPANYSLPNDLLSIQHLASKEKIKKILKDFQRNNLTRYLVLVIIESAFFTLKFTRKNNFSINELSCLFEEGYGQKISPLSLIIEAFDEQTLKHFRADWGDFYVNYLQSYSNFLLKEGYDPPCITISSIRSDYAYFFDDLEDLILDKKKTILKKTSNDIFLPNLKIGKKIALLKDSEYSTLSAGSGFYLHHPLLKKPFSIIAYLSELIEAIEQAEKDGVGFFFIGIEENFELVQKKNQNRTLWTPEGAKEFFEYSRKAATKLQSSSIPTFGLIKNNSFGLTLELMQACDEIIVEPNINCGFPEAEIGLLPHAGGFLYLLKIAQKLKDPLKALESYLEHIIFGEIVHSARLAIDAFFLPKKTLISFNYENFLSLAALKLEFFMINGYYPQNETTVTIHGPDVWSKLHSLLYNWKTSQKINELQYEFGVAFVNIVSSKEKKQNLDEEKIWKIQKDYFIHFTEERSAIKKINQQHFAVFL